MNNLKELRVNNQNKKRLNKNIDVLNNQSQPSSGTKINSTNNMLISHNLGNKDKNNLSKDNKGIKINVVNIHNNKNIYNLKSSKKEINKKSKSNIKNNSNPLFRTINDLQDMDYSEAIIYDKRNCIKIYWGFLVNSQIILSTFFTDNHLDLFIIKLSFFIFTFQITFFLNAFFYTDDYISDAYHNDGILDFFSGLPKSIYSFVATLVTTDLLRMLSSSRGELVRLIKQRRNFKNYLYFIQLKLSKLRKKLIIYFILVFLFALSFTYYVTAFCAVYKNSQMYWFYGCLESFGMDFIVALTICIFLALFRFISIKKRIKCLYILANIISTFI